MVVFVGGSSTHHFTLSRHSLFASLRARERCWPNGPTRVHLLYQCQSTMRAGVNAPALIVCVVGQEYNASTSSANCCMMTLRFSLSVGVICPPSSVKSSGRMANLRIDSACETDWLA